MYPVMIHVVDHRVPLKSPQQIRSDTAETLYLVLQSKDVGFETDEVEEILLETEWCALYFFLTTFNTFASFIVISSLSYSIACPLPLFVIF